MAERWGKTIRIYLDMPATLYFEQMPDNASANWTGRRGDSREHTIRWPDGSRVITVWRPGPEVGLVLDYIGRIGRWVLTASAVTAENQAGSQGSQGSVTLLIARLTTPAE